MKNTKIRRHQAGDIILQEGDYNKTLHKILSGKVALYLNYGKTNEYLIETLTFPQYFGEVSILIQHPCYCTAVAIEDTTILHIAAENFEEFIQNNTQNAFLIMKAMAKSLDSLNLLLHKIEHGTHPYAHEEITEEIPLLSTEEFLAVPDSKTLFMQEHLEDDLHEKFADSMHSQQKKMDTEPSVLNQNDMIQTIMQNITQKPQPTTAQLRAELDAETNLLVQQTLQANRITQNTDTMVQSIMQSIANEASQAQTAYHILPEVYPDFFLPGHKCYPNITHPEYKNFVFQKEYTCPHCKQTFESHQISYTRLVADPALSKKMRLDFHIFYKNFEAEWYDVITCPHCYFSSLIDMFIKPPYVRKEQFDKELLQIRASMMLDFSAERTLDFVFMQHYIALACSRAFSAKYKQINACLWMNLCWLYRSVQDQEMVRLAEDKTIEAYAEMYRDCDLSSEQQQRTCLTIAGIYFDREDFAMAREWAFAVRMNRDGKVIYRNLAQSIIDEARYLSSEKKKEEEARKIAEARMLAEAQKAEEERIIAEAKEAARREAEARKEEKLRKKEEARREAEAAQKGWFPQGGHALT